jgi:hypothetical protein
MEFQKRCSFMVLNYTLPFTTPNFETELIETGHFLSYWFVAFYATIPRKNRDRGKIGKY